jgi:hypothetical protein
MPNNYEIVDNTTGEVLVVTGETPPTPEDAAIIFAQRRQQQRIAPRATPQLQPTAPAPGVADLGMEAIAGFNRPFAWLMDNTLMAPINTVRGFQGKPPLSIESALGAKGQFAGEGALTDVAAASGELASIGLGGGTILRAGASMLDDAARIGGSTWRRVLKEMGRTTPSLDVTMGVASGSGGEVTAQLAERFAGEQFEQLGRGVGQVISPVVWGTTVGALINTGKNLFKLSTSSNILESAPTTTQLKGAARGLYTKLDEAGIVADEASVAYIRSQVDNFRAAEEITDGLYPTVNRYLSILESKTADPNGVSYGYLDRLHSLLRGVGNSDSAEGTAALKLAEVVDDMIMSIRPANSDVLEGDTVSNVIGNAREFWRRGKASQLLDDVFNSARIDTLANRGGFAQNIKRELVTVLKNDKAMKSFTATERKRLEGVITGTRPERAYEFFGAFGANSDDWYRAVMLSAVAGTLPVMTGQPVVGGAVATGILAAGFTASRLANMKAGQVLSKNAALMRATMNANGDAEGIIKNYLSTVPSSQRNPADLSALLLANKADLSMMRDAPMARSPFIADSIYLTQMGQAAVNNEQASAQERQQ